MMRVIAGILASAISFGFGIVAAVFLHPPRFDFAHHKWDLRPFIVCAVLNSIPAVIFAGLTAFAFPSRWWLGASLFSLPVMVGIIGELRNSDYLGGCAGVVCICGAFGSAMLSNRRNRAMKGDV